MSNSFIGGSLPFPFNFDLVLHVFPMRMSVPIFFWQRNSTRRAGCDVKRHLMLPTGQAAPTCLTACIYPVSKPGFVQ